MTEKENLFHEIGQAMPEAEQSQMFGKPCYKIHGKAFICFFENEMVFKLTGEMHAEAIVLSEAKLFDPSGKNRPMKEWVQLPFTQNALWPKFAKGALHYVAGK